MTLWSYDIRAALEHMLHQLMCGTASYHRRAQEAAALQIEDHMVALDLSALFDAGMISASKLRRQSDGGITLILPSVTSGELWGSYYAPQRMMTPSEPLRRTLQCCLFTKPAGRCTACNITILKDVLQPLCLNTCRRSHTGCPDQCHHC